MEFSAFRFDPESVCADTDIPTFAATDVCKRLILKCIAFEREEMLFVRKGDSVLDSSGFGHGHRVQEKGLVAMVYKPRQRLGRAVGIGDNRVGEIDGFESSG